MTWSDGTPTIVCEICGYANTPAESFWYQGEVAICMDDDACKKRERLNIKREIKMVQKIRFECDDAINVSQLNRVKKIAQHFPDSDLRVNSDPTNIKVYVGEYYHELFRFWVDVDGKSQLVERDTTPKEDEADWVTSDAHTATLALVDQTPAFQKAIDKAQGSFNQGGVSTIYA